MSADLPEAQQVGGQAGSQDGADLAEVSTTAAVDADVEPGGGPGSRASGSLTRAAALS